MYVCFDAMARNRRLHGSGIMEPWTTASEADPDEDDAIAASRVPATDGGER